MDAKVFFQRLLGAYIVGFIFPFVYVITSKEKVGLTKTLYVLCLITICFLFTFEILQIKAKGIKYFRSSWNLNDFIHFILFFVLWNLRYRDILEFIGRDAKKGDDSGAPG